MGTSHVQVSHNYVILIPIIYLLPIISKCLEDHIKQVLLELLYQQSVLQGQFRFCASRSTTLFLATHPISGTIFCKMTSTLPMLLIHIEHFKRRDCRLPIKKHNQ